MARAKSVIYGVLGIIIGIVLFFGGISTLSKPDQVTCGGQTMSQGDTCEHYRNGVQTGTSDYEQEKQSNHGTGIFLLIFGPLMVVGSVFLLGSGLRRRRPMSYPAPNYMRPQANRPPQPGAYPPPAYPPQQPGAYPPPYPPQQPGNPPPYYPQR